MTVKDMHYDFKVKFNSLDGQVSRGLKIPEIDWLLNRAQEAFIDAVAQPRTNPFVGFEMNQKAIDDLRTIVVDNYCKNVRVFTSQNSSPNQNSIVSLPDDYMYFASGKVYISKGNCVDIPARLVRQKHNYDFENSEFDKSSFEWRTVNMLFVEKGLKLFTDGTFSHSKVCISYVRRPKYIHYAEGYRGGQYKLPSGEILQGFQNCELPEHTHPEIVDAAVQIALQSILIGSRLGTK